MSAELNRQAEEHLKRLEAGPSIAAPGAPASVRLALVGLERGELPSHQASERDDLLSAAEALLDGRTVFVRALPPDRLGGLLSLVPREVLRVQVGDVEEAVLRQAEVNERRLDRWLDVQDVRLVDIPDVGCAADPLDVQFLQRAVLYHRNATLVPLHVVDQHFLFHASAFHVRVRDSSLPGRPARIAYKSYATVVRTRPAAAPAGRPAIASTSPGRAHRCW